MSTQPDDSAPPRGAIILGGAHGALAAARSLGREGVPVVLVSNDHPLPKFSRYIRKRFDWPGPAASNAAEWLAELAVKEGFNGWLLIPAADADVRFVATERDTLGKTFRVASASWDDLRHLCDKQLLAERAESLGIASPKRYAITSLAQAAAAQLRFPVVLKPSTRENVNAFTQAKAWRADTQDEFLALYREAASLVGEGSIVIQELIPGDGRAQASYAAAWAHGRCLASITATRTRQFPVEFSYTSTYVEIADWPDLKIAAEKLLKPIAFEGLVEIEFKFDARDGALKILDVNPRPWTWLALADASGVNLTHALFAGTENSAPPKPMAWAALARDLMAATQLATRGEFQLLPFARSYLRPLVWASFAWDDPVPGLAELPLLALRGVTRRLPGLVRRWRNGAAKSRIA